MILVTRAGKVGSETARLLRERDVPVRVLVRDPAKATARALAEAGAEIAAGDLAVPASIDEAMSGVSGVVLVSPAVPPRNSTSSPAPPGPARATSSRRPARPRPTHRSRGGAGRPK